MIAVRCGVIAARRCGGRARRCSASIRLSTRSMLNRPESRQIACQAGGSAPWEHFITSFRPQLYAAARAIAAMRAAGVELADSLWAEMYGMEVRDGRRRSTPQLLSWPSSLLTWMRAGAGATPRRFISAPRAVSRRWDDQSRAANWHDDDSRRGIRRARALRGDAGKGVDAALKALDAAGPNADGVLTTGTTCRSRRLAV